MPAGVSAGLNFSVQLYYSSELWKYKMIPAKQGRRVFDMQSDAFVHAGWNCCGTRDHTGLSAHLSEG